MIVWVNAEWFRPQAIAEAADLQTISDQQVVVPVAAVVFWRRAGPICLNGRGLLKVSATALPTPSAETGESLEGQVQALAGPDYRDSNGGDCLKRRAGEH